MTSIARCASASTRWCAPVSTGPNLAARALEALRERGWSRPPLSIEIEKRIPIAAGLGGGSADAAAVLRLARDEVDDLEELAAELGADVPVQLDPGRALVRGAGERVERLERSEEYGVVLIPATAGLATADVYAEADRLGLGRDALGARRARRASARRRGRRRVAARLPGAARERSPSAPRCRCTPRSATRSMRWSRLGRRGR